MIRIGQKIDDFAFDVYQGHEIKKVKFSNYRGKWLVLLFYPVDFASSRPGKPEEAANYYDRFTKGGAEIVAVSINTVSAQKTRHGDSPSMKRVIPFPIAADAFAKLSRYFGIYIEDARACLLGTFIVDPNGVLRARTLKTGSPAGAAMRSLANYECEATHSPPS